MANALTIVRGSIETFIFTVTDSGTVMDITGAAIYFAARRDWPAATIVSDSDASIAKSTVSGGIVITDGANGVFELTLLHADTNTLQLGDYPYGVELIPYGDSEPYAVEQDILTITVDSVRAI
jgi:hypothetical protein